VAVVVWVRLAGCITIEWDRLTLLNMNGKPVGNAQLVRQQ
jgi:hypothetical protein